MATSTPPHNVAELIDAAEILIDKPDATVEELMGPVQGPDFPTGGVIVESARAIREAYTTGRGSMWVRARWHVEDQGRGTYAIVVTEIPYKVQKFKLVEQIAALINDSKLPLQSGRAYVCTPVTNAYIVCRLLLEKKSTLHSLID